MNANDGPKNDESKQPAEVKVEANKLKPEKTPMYEASNAARYYRQAQIRSIQEATGNHLLCYVAGPNAAISRDDTLGIAELLHNVPPNSNIDFLLHTTGGDIAAAEKIVIMLRGAVGTGKFRVIVPDFAKSAGTLIAIAGDKIVMSHSSELGPIDPQFQLQGSDGNFRMHSAFNYIQAYRTLCEKLNANPDDASTKLLLEKLDPTTVVKFEAICTRARVLAENHLRRWMFHEEVGNFTQIATDLIDTKKWLAHDQVINSEFAISMGLRIEVLEPKFDTWRQYWKLYCLLRLAVKDDGKLFEAGYASLPM